MGRRVMNGDNAPHLERLPGHSQRVGDGELVVYLVGRVAVEDYTCGVHRLLSRGLCSVTPP